MVTYFCFPEDTSIQVQNPRFSSTSSTDDECLANQDQLVVAQVHFHSIKDEQKLDSDDDLGTAKNTQKRIL